MSPNCCQLGAKFKSHAAYWSVKYHCIIAVDFNCNGIDWQTLKAPCDGRPNLDALRNVAIGRVFSQVVKSPTRGDNLLDLVLSNEPLAMCNAITSV